MLLEKIKRIIWSAMNTYGQHDLFYEREFGSIARARNIYKAIIQKKYDKAVTLFNEEQKHEIKLRERVIEHCFQPDHKRGLIEVIKKLPHDSYTKLLEEELYLRLIDNQNLEEFKVLLPDLLTIPVRPDNFGQVARYNEQQKASEVLVELARLKAPVSYLELIMKKGAHIDHKDNWGYTAFMYAVKNAEIKDDTYELGAVRFLYNKKANLHIKNRLGQNALSVAYEAQNYVIFCYLLNQGVSYDVAGKTSSKPMSSLFETVRQDSDTRYFEALIKNGIKENHYEIFHEDFLKTRFENCKIWIKEGLSVNTLYENESIQSMVEEYAYLKKDYEDLLDFELAQRKIELKDSLAQSLPEKANFSVKKQKI